jgi:hypothetical protein
MHAVGCRILELGHDSDMRPYRKLQGQLIVSRSHRSIAQWLNVAKGV